ncbi:MAG: GntR family transcriptional regulator [Chloroflexi bacterium]|nr:GntR family transcriptional regulator [Chloroflexota bacterium]
MTVIHNHNLLTAQPNQPMDHIFEENQPIYLQIIQRIYAQILRGVYQPGDKLPSVIEAAMTYKVNHNTIARVYSEIARAGVGVTRRGEGTFVTEDQTVLEQLHASMRRSLLENFITEMRRLGYSSSEILETLEQYIQDEDAALSVEEDK